MKWKQMHLTPVLTTIFTIAMISPLAVYTAYGENPHVTNVQAAQRTDGSMKVDVSYDLSDADGDNITISLSVSDDSGLTYTIIPESATGDIYTGITPGSRKSIIWDAGKDLPGVYGTEYVVKVLADDGKGDENTLGYKTSTVIGKALKYGAFSSKHSTFGGISKGGKKTGFGKIANRLNHTAMPGKYPLHTPYPNETPYPHGTPSYTPYPGSTPPPGSGDQGIEGFTYNGDGTFTGTPEEGTTIKISFYKSDGTQITVDITDFSNYQAGGALYGEDTDSFLFQVEATVDVKKGATTVHMEMISELTDVNPAGCPDEVKMTGSGTFEFADIGTGEATDLTATVSDCGENVSGSVTIAITIDGEDCEITHEFDQNGCLGGPISCNGVNLGEMVRDNDDGHLYYLDSTTGEKTLIDESLFSSEGEGE